MDPIESALREDFLSALFGGEEADEDPRELLGNGVKQGGIEITDPRKLANWGHETSVKACEVLIELLVGAADLNYIGYWSCVRKGSNRASNARERERSQLHWHSGR